VKCLFFCFYVEWIKKKKTCYSDQFDNLTSAITDVVSIGFLGWDEVTEYIFILIGRFAL
jgi:hypothetical protein